MIKQNCMAVIVVVCSLVFVSSVFGIEPGDVVINELMWTGTSLSSMDEWIELRNMTALDIDLSGWELTKLSSDIEKYMLAISSGTVISAGSYVVISCYGKDDSNINIEPDLVSSSVSLVNSKLQIKLYDGQWESTGTLIDVADDGSGAPLAGDNINKYSMQRKQIPGDGTIADNWFTAITSYNWDDGAIEKGTPGADNTSGDDITAPGEVHDLSAVSGDTIGEITLTWTAPCEDAAVGGAVDSYDIRYATETFTNDEWDSSRVLSVSDTLEVPKLPGNQESIVIKGLIPGVRYYFALKSQDESGNISSIDERTLLQNQAYSKAKQNVTIVITEVSFNSSPDWIELYNYGQFPVDIAEFVLTDLDGVDTCFADLPVTLFPLGYAVIYWDKEGIDETDTTGDTNNNGIIDIYVDDSSLTSTDDQAVLLSAQQGAEYVDAVCWTDNNGSFSSGEISDVEALVAAGIWSKGHDVAEESDCWSHTSSVSDVSSIGRYFPLSDDTDSKDDWMLFDRATAGQDNFALRITSPVDDSFIEQGEDIIIATEVICGEVNAISFAYKAIRDEEWINIGGPEGSGYSIVFPTAGLDPNKNYHIHSTSNKGVVTPSVTITLVKAQPPDTELILYPEGTLNTSSVSFAYSGQDNVTSDLLYSYKLDDSSWSQYTKQDSVSFENISDGAHVFEVRSRDRANLQDDTPALCIFTIDTVAPRLEISGPSHMDRVTGNAVEIKTSYSDEDIERVVFYFRTQGGQWEEIGVARQVPYSVSWDTMSLADGILCEVKAEAFDELGNVDSNPSVVAVYIERNDPTYGSDKNVINTLDGGILIASDGTWIKISPGALQGDNPIECSISMINPDAGMSVNNSRITPTHIIRDISFSNGQSYFEGGKLATISIPYNEDKLSNVNEEHLRLFWFDELANEWELVINSKANPEMNRVEGEIEHCSLFQIMELAPAVDLSGARIYPNPCYASKGEKVYITNLPSGSTTIYFYTLTGELVKTMQTEQNSVQWDLRNEHLRKVASGVYIYLISNNNTFKTGKIAVIK